MKATKLIFTSLLVLFLATGAAKSAEEKNSADNKPNIKKVLREYAEAYKNGDQEKMARIERRLEKAEQNSGRSRRQFQDGDSKKGDACDLGKEGCSEEGMKDRMRERFENMSPEEKEQFKQKMQERREKFESMTPEEREAFKEKMQGRREHRGGDFGRPDQSGENQNRGGEYRKDREFGSEEDMRGRMRERFENMSPEEKEQFKQKMQERREKFESMTPEERDAFKEKMQARKEHRGEGIGRPDQSGENQNRGGEYRQGKESNPEQKEARVKKYFEKMTPQQRKELIDILKDMNKEDTLSPDIN